MSTDDVITADLHSCNKTGDPHEPEHTSQRFGSLTLLLSHQISGKPSPLEPRRTGGKLASTSLR